MDSNTHSHSNALIQQPNHNLNQAEINSQLQRAARDGNFKLSYDLIYKHHADFLSHDRAGNTPLMLAARHGHTSVVHSLIMARPDLIDMKNQDNYTALMLSARFGHTDTVRALIKHRAGFREIALLYSARYGQADTVKFLLSIPGMDMNQRDEQGNTALILAARHGHTKVVSAFMPARRAHIDWVNYEGNSPLMLAARYGHTAICEELIVKGGANVEIENLTGGTAKTLASHPSNSRAHLEVVNTLIDLEIMANELMNIGLHSAEPEKPSDLPELALVPFLGFQQVATGKREIREFEEESKIESSQKKSRFTKPFAHKRESRGLEIERDKPESRAKKSRVGNIESVCKRVKPPKINSEFESNAEEHKRGDVRSTKRRK
jgi:ankyrin repeat protein